MLMANAGQVVKREDIMDEVWDPHWFGPTKTLDVHISWLRKKLEDDPADPRYITTIRGVGFRFAAPEDIAYPAKARRHPGAAGRRSPRRSALDSYWPSRYILLVVIVALTVPLAHQLARARAAPRSRRRRSSAPRRSPQASRENVKAGPA